jgi:protein-tyrosine phosphatase
MANICRSPMAEAVLHGMAQADGRLSLELDSAGTRVARPGVRPDSRAEAALLRRGYEVLKARSRQLVEEDFDSFDLLLAMDRPNLADMLGICPPHHRRKVGLFLAFAPESGLYEVPDPYFGSAQGFERVLDLCELGSRGLLESLGDRSALTTAMRS